MNLKMIRLKHETEDILLSIFENSDSLLNKLIQKLKKHLNSNLPNQGKHFISIHQLKLKKIGWLD